MMGLVAAPQVKGEGTVEGTFKDDYGVNQFIRVHVYYIPTSSVRLFSPQSYFIQEGGSFSLNKDGFVFTFASGKTLIFDYAKGSKLLIVYA